MRASFSILGWIDWCLLGVGGPVTGHGAMLFQYPRVDRLVSAGASDLPSDTCTQYVSVSSGGSIGVCWPTTWRSCTPCSQSFSILGWIDWCLLAGTAGCHVWRSSTASFSILGWIDWCLLGQVRGGLCDWRRCFSILGWIDWCLLVIRASVSSVDDDSFSILGWIDWCLLVRSIIFSV